MEEDIDHLFFSCDFARSCWQTLHIQWDEDQSLLPRTAQTRAQQNLHFVDFVDSHQLGAVETPK